MNSDFIVQALLRATPAPILVFDQQRRLVRWNDAARSCFSLPEVQHDIDVQKLPFAEQLKRWLGQPGDHAEWTAGEDGACFLPHSERLDDGGTLVLLKDITELRKLARNQNEFVRLVAHDLRSPLTSIQGFASMLEQPLVGELNDQQKHFISKILAGIGQLSKLIENFQDAGRFDPETGFYEMNRAPCDVGEIVHRIVYQQVIPPDKQKLRLSESIDNDLPVVMADNHMVERAVANLVDNAIKYTPDGGVVEVRVRRTDEQIVVSVRDNGFGIRPEDVPRLFQRGVRPARAEFKRIKGTGLGLFIVRSIAQRHDGWAWVESELGAGSTFYFSISFRSQSPSTYGSA
jgi:two-component system phosphate regulon sensor histidine kinase PhoR